MKFIWAIVTLLVLGGLIVLLQPTATDSSGRALDQATQRELDKALAAAPATAPKPKPAEPKSAEPKPAEPKPQEPRPTESKPAETKPAETTPAETKPAETTPSEKPADTKPAETKPAESKPTPSSEPAKPDPSKLAAGERFEPEIAPIAHAEIIPSTFIKLADGSISADDAWTIRGDGSPESPYEVSWEFLASAQDTYVPRLSENKIPARIAFLSGKRVRISGYLAFPLVAQTSGECLVMLNQWDGCCIGIPPTPYDAIEVKLATQMKGWKKHTFNFGAIEGTFAVEPYLVENWLVGLYMLRDAKLNREL